MERRELYVNTELDPDYYRKIFLYIGCALAVAGPVRRMNSGVFVEGFGYTLSLSAPRSRWTPWDQEELEAGRLQALVLWDKESEVSEKYAGNLERLLGQMEFSWSFWTSGRRTRCLTPTTTW